MSVEPEPLFHEEQGLAQPRVRLAVATVPLIFLLLVIWQVILGHPWGRRPLSNASLIWWTIFSALIYWRLVTVKLVTELWPDKLSIRMRGLLRVRHIPLTQIVGVQVVTFDAARDYGGSGIRTVGRTKAYLARGGSGVSLKLNLGSTVVLGSQRADTLAARIESARKSLAQ